MNPTPCSRKIKHDFMNCEFEVKEGNSPKIPKNYVDTLTVCRCLRLCGPQVHCNLRMRFLLFCLDTSIYRLNLFFFCCQLLKLRFIPLLDLLFCWALGTRCICWSSRRTKRGPEFESCDLEIHWRCKYFEYSKHHDFHLQ